MYDYLIVGSGLFGSVCANELKKQRKKVLVIEKRSHIGGNAFTENIDGIPVHKYGAHIFHTNNEEVWKYVNELVEFNRFTNSPLAYFKGKLYNLPFNMNTFYQMWGTISPLEAKNKIDEQRSRFKGGEPKNLEEQAISLVGEDLYNNLIKGYTEKQWGRKTTELPAFIIKRIPVRFTYDNNYFSDKYQGIPVGGYTRLIEKMLDGVDVILNVDYLEEKEKYDALAKMVIYTGPIDKYFDYTYGPLEYRSLNFETQSLEMENFQGNAVINYTESSVPYTRIIEHKHFDSCNSPVTIITKEYPCEWKLGDEPYYPINDEKNMELYKKYRELSLKETNTIFGGRLAEYKYYDMHQVIAAALYQVKRITAS